MTFKILSFFLVSLAFFTAILAAPQYYSPFTSYGYGQSSYYGQPPSYGQSFSGQVPYYNSPYGYGNGLTGGVFGHSPVTGEPANPFSLFGAIAMFL